MRLGYAKKVAEDDAWVSEFLSFSRQLLNCCRVDCKWLLIVDAVVCCCVLLLVVLLLLLVGALAAVVAVVAVDC